MRKRLMIFSVWFNMLFLHFEDDDSSNNDFSPSVMDKVLDNTIHVASRARNKTICTS